MALEHPNLITAWVAHHLDLGADRIHLFLDHQSPELMNTLPDHPRLTKTLCDTAFWQSLSGSRPDLIANRQCAVFQSVLDASTADFVFHIDVDEFLSGQGSLAHSLSLVDPAADCVVLTSMERVHMGAEDPDDIFSGAFRRQHGAMHQPQVDAADGPCAPFLQWGMTAYAGGKSGLRTGRNLTVGVHYPRPLRPRRSAPLWGWELLHFDGLTQRHWTGKRLRVLDNQPNAPQNAVRFRAMQLNEVARLVSKRQPPETLYQELKTLSPQRSDILAGLGLISDQPFAPRLALDRVFPGHVLDLSAAAFDSYQITRQAF